MNLISESTNMLIGVMEKQSSDKKWNSWHKNGWVYEKFV